MSQILSCTFLISCSCRKVYNFTGQLLVRLGQILQVNFLPNEISDDNANWFYLQYHIHITVGYSFGFNSIFCSHDVIIYLASILNKYAIIFFAHQFQTKYALAMPTKKLVTKKNLTDFKRFPTVIMGSNLKLEKIR